LYLEFGPIPDLGHIIENSCSSDAAISRELKSLFDRTNLLKAATDTGELGGN